MTNPTGEYQYQLDSSEADEIDFSQFFSLFLNNIWLIVASLVIAGGLGVVYALSIDPKYSAETEIYIEDAASTGFDPNDLFSSTTPDTKKLESELLVIESNLLVGQVVDKLDLISDPEFNGQLNEPSFIKKAQKQVVDAFRKMLGDDPANDLPPTEEQIRHAVIERVTSSLGARIVEDTFILRISFSASTPRKAARLAGAFAEVYIADRLAVQAETTNEALEYLRGRIPKLKEELDDIEVRITDFQSSGGVMGSEALVATNAQLAKRIEQLNRLNQKYSESLAIRRKFVGAVANDVQAQVILRELSQDAPNVSGEAAIALATQQLLQVDQWIERYSDQRSQLEEAIDSLRARVQTQGTKSASLEQLRREAEATRAIYDSFLTKLKEVSQNAAVQERDVRVISSPVPPSLPYEPRKKMIVAVFGALGMLLGMALALFKEFYTAPFRSPGEFKQVTGVSILTATPMIKGDINFMSTDVSKSRRMITGAIRNMRSLLLIDDEEKQRTKSIAITSTLPSEGKTTTALLLAEVSAGAGERTVVVDCDLWRRKLTSELLGNNGASKGKKGENEPPMVGVAQILKGEAVLAYKQNTVSTDGVRGIRDDATINTEVVRRTKMATPVDFIPAGSDSEAAAQLLVSARFRKMIETLEEHYDTIIIDCPPMVAGSDAKVISRVTDATLFLVRAGRAKRGIVKHHFDDLRASAGNRVKVVLTGARSKGGGYGNYGYGYGYGYGGYGYGYGRSNAA